MKKGRLSKSEKEFIKGSDLAVPEIAKKLGRSDDAILKVILESAPVVVKEPVKQGDGMIFNPKPDGNRRDGDTNYSTPTAIEVGENTFVDDRQTENTTEADALMYISQPVSRVRDSGMVKATCRGGCGITKEVNRQFTRLQDGVLTHLCERCILGRGGR